MTSPTDTSYPLTGPQKLIWVNEHLFPGTALHTIAGAAVLRGPLDEDRFAAAVTAYFAGSSAMRMVIRSVDGEPRQVFAKDAPAISRLDLREDPEPEAAFRRWVDARVRAPMPLLEAPLCEVALVRLARDHTALYLRAHHIAADGYSLALFLEGILTNYAQLVATGGITEPVRSSYEAVIETDRAYQGSARYQADRDRWTAALGALREPARLCDEDLTALPTTAARKTFRLGADATRRLAAVSEELHAAPFCVVAGVLASVLARITGNAEVCIGTPIFNRRTKAERATFGMMVNTAPLPFVVDPDAGLGKLILDAGRLTKAAIAGARFPSVGLRRPGSANPLGLFDVELSYQNAVFRKAFAGVDVELEWFFNGHEMNAATVHFHDRQQERALTFDIDYRIAAVPERLVDALGDAIVQGIDDACDAVARERPVSRLPLTRSPLTLRGEPAGEPDLAPARLQAVLAAHADREALRWDGGSLRYAELAEHIATRLTVLRDAGVAPGDRVVIWAQRSVDVVAMLLATWAAGAAYVPIDASAPAARAAAIVADAEARVVITDRDPAELPAGVCVLHPRDRAAGAAAWARVDPSDVAYVIFTSGSTGRPKGVAVDHRGLAHYLDFAVERYAHGRPTSCPLFTSLGFDLTVTSLFLPLLTGGCLRIFGEDADHEGDLLARVLADEHAQVIKLTPAHLALISRLALQGPQVTAYVVGGEALPAATAAAIDALHGGRAEIINEYGPTDAVVGCTIHAYRRHDAGRDVSIGLPIPGTTLRIVTPWGQDQAPGAEGELLIGGRGLAVGYVGRPELTAERFGSDEAGQRWYRTGDRVRLRPDGALDFLGRTDRQIKIRGFRIELGEIEAAYRAETGDAACVALDVRGATDERALALFYVAPAEREARTVRSALARRLPAYLLPAALIRIDAVPLNANRKVDRAALQRIYDDARAAPGDAAALVDLSPTAARGLAILRSLLGGTIDLGRSFVETGGDSITAIQAISRLQAEGLGGTVRGLLRGASLGEFLAGVSAAGVVRDRAPATGPLPQPLPAVRWFLDEHFEHAAHWHQSVVLRPRVALDPERLGHALHAVIRAHDALRLHLGDDGQTLVLDPAHLETPPVVAVQALPAGDEAGILASAQDMKRGTDLRADLLIKAALLTFSDGDARLVLVAHHLVIDVVSWHVVLADLSAAYAALARGDAPALDPEGTSFVEWCAAVATLAESLPAAEQARCRDAIARVRALPALPAAPLAPNASAIRTIQVELDGDVAQQLLRDAHRAFSTQPQDLVLAAAVAAVARHVARDAVSVEYESHGRHEIAAEHDLARTVGRLTALTPLVFAAPTAAHPELLVIDVKDRLRDLPGNGLGCGALRERGAPLHPMLRFNYLGLATAATGDALFDLASESTGPEVAPDNHATAAVELLVEVRDAGFVLTLHLDARCFDPGSASQLAARLVDELRAVARLCMAQQETRLTPSDFPAADLTLEELDSLFTAALGAAAHSG